MHAQVFLLGEEVVPVFLRQRVGNEHDFIVVAGTVQVGSRTRGVSDFRGGFLAFTGETRAAEAGKEEEARS